MGIPADIAALVPQRGEWEDRAWFPPGPALGICLSGGRARLGDLSDTELLEVAAAAHRQAAWAQARELAAIAELTRRRTEDERDDQPDHRVLSARESVTEEVASTLAVTGNAAATLVHLAERLSTDLSDTGAALEAGRIDLAKARVICDLSEGLPEDVAGRVEAAVLDNASRQTTGQLRRRMKRIVRRLAPEAVAERKRAAMRGRRLELWETPSGTADLALLDLAPEDAHAIHNKITAVAAGLRHDGDPRPLNVIRADLATALLHGADLPQAVRAQLAAPDSGESPTVAVSPEPPASGDLRVAASDAVVIDDLSRRIDRYLTGILDRSRAEGRLNELPEQITRAVQKLHLRLSPARVSHCQGSAERHGHPGYRPPAMMRREVEARHGTCVFPTCNVRSSRCDLDHTVPWSPGSTCPCNLAPLCRRHHRMKQTAGWRLLQVWPGLLVWITPSGAWHITRPDRC